MFTPIASRTAVLVAVVGISAATLTGCGGASSGPTTTPQAGSSNRPAAGFGLDPTQQKEVQKCLKASGLSSALPTGRPSGPPTEAQAPDHPASRADAPPPSRRVVRVAASQIRRCAALQACGITLPSRPAGAPSQQAG